MAAAAASRPAARASGSEQSIEVGHGAAVSLSRQPARRAVVKRGRPARSRWSVTSVQPPAPRTSAGSASPCWSACSMPSAATGHQEPGGGPEEPPDDVEAVGAAPQGERRVVVGDLLRHPRAVGHVRRVGDDDVDACRRGHGAVRDRSCRRRAPRPGCPPRPRGRRRCAGSTRWRRGRARRRSPSLPGARSRSTGRGRPIPRRGRRPSAPGSRRPGRAPSPPAAPSPDGGRRRPVPRRARGAGTARGRSGAAGARGRRAGPAARRIARPPRPAPRRA